MLRSIVITPDSEMAERLEAFLADFGHIAVLRTVSSYPNARDLVRMVRAHAPHIVFLGMESILQAEEAVRTLDEETPGIQYVAIHRNCDPQMLLEVMRIGVREFVSLPLSREVISEMTVRLQEKLSKRAPEVGATDQLYAFLPAKSGSGCTTLAVNIAAAMARVEDASVLLADFDLGSGIIRFMLKLDGLRCVLDACERAGSLDEEVWSNLVTNWEGMDVLHAGKLNPNVRIEGAQIRYIIDFARRQYKSICVDLSGNLERYSIELMQEAKRIFLVATPEIPSLHLAREKYMHLQSLDLGDRVSLLLNRTQRRSEITTAQIEQLLRLPIEASFPNDYNAVQKALRDAKIVERNTELGKCFTDMAKSMVRVPEADKEAGPTEAPGKKRFSDYLSIFPGKLSLFSDSKKA